MECGIVHILGMLRRLQASYMHSITASLVPFDLVNHAVHVFPSVEIHSREIRRLYRQIQHASTTATKPSYTVDTEPEYLPNLVMPHRAGSTPDDLFGDECCPIVLVVLVPKG